MPIKEHPPKGSLLVCDFNQGFIEPEIVKKRLVVVVSPKIALRKGLCTVVALSTTAPNPVMPYHCQIDIHPTLPSGFDSKGIWVKGDMLYAIGFHRLDFVRKGKDSSGKRLYYYNTLNEQLL